MKGKKKKTITTQFEETEQASEPERDLEIIKLNI